MSDYVRTVLESCPPGKTGICVGTMFTRSRDGDRFTLIVGGGSMNISDAVQYLNTGEKVPDPDKSRDMVEVLCLESGDRFVYVNTSPRTAILRALYLDGFGDGNTWSYAELDEKYIGRTRVGPSGRTVSISVAGRTYSAVI